MLLKNQILFSPLIWAPLLGYILVSFVGVSYYNFLSVWTWISVSYVLLDKMGKRQKINFPTYLKFLLIFVLYTIFSDYLLAGKILNIKYFYSNYLISGFLAALWAENVYVDKHFIKRATRVSLVFLFIAFVVILYQQLIDNYFFVNNLSENVLKVIRNPQDYEKRLPSIYSWTSLLDINFGFIGIATLLFSAYISKVKKNILMFFILLIIIFSFLTKARWIMLNALLVIIMYMLYKGFSIKKILINFGIFYVILIVGLQTLEYVNIPVKSIVEERILEKNKGELEETSAGTRILAFYVFSRLFPEHPVFGKGMLHSFGGHSKDTGLVTALAGKSSQIHVGYLSLLYYYGIVGGSLFLFFLYFLMKKFYSEAKQSKFWGAFFVYLGFILANATLVNFTIFYYGLIIAIIFHNFYYQKFLKEKQRFALI